jgi:hypothetical protein
MKKIILLVLMSVFAFCAQAQSLIATLQQGDVVTPFYGENAFRNAYEAAQDGAVITLSTGNHYKSGSLEVKKSITIIGSGAYGVDEAISYVNAISVRANNVRVEGLYIKDGINFEASATDSRVLHCYLNKLEGWKHFNTIVEQCVIKESNVIGNDFKNLCIKNCIIERLGSGYNSETTFINDVIYKISYVVPMKDTYRNCVIGLEEREKTLESPGEFYNNVFFKYEENNIDFELNLRFAEGCVHSGNSIDTYNNIFGGVIDYSAMPNTTALGDDGKKVGPEGGTGYKLYPAIPRIISKQIDRQTDAEGKINVNIQVKAED